MTPLSFVQQRIADIEHYINNVELRFEGKPAQTQVTQDFSQVFNNKIEQVELEQEKAKHLGKLPPDFGEYMSATVQQISGSYGVELPETLVMSVIKQESGFNPNAESGAGAQGLMQLMPATAKEVGVFNSMNPYQNLKGGVKYLAEMITEFDGNIPKALAAYNAGPNAVKKHNGIPPYRETENYVESIMKDFLRQENYQSVDLTV